MTAENARKKIRFYQYLRPIFLANIIAMNVDNAVSQSTCFCEAFDLVFRDQKVFIMCQHLIVYLSHITIVCPIIASKYIPGS